MSVQDTSLLSWCEISTIDLGERQYAVLNAIRDLGSSSNSEIARHLGRPINTITPRVHELRKKGILVIACRRSCKVTGRQVLTWEEVKRRW